jgi:predicted nucleotidyltransferase
LLTCDSLENEVQKFHDYVVPSTEEIEARRRVAEEVKSIIKDVSSKKFRKIYSAELFGSAVHGTALATSDIDIRIVDKRLSDKQWAPSASYRKRMEKVLWTLRNRFAALGYQDAKVVHARYPLVSMIHKESKIAVQIVASNADNNQKQLIKTWITTDPQILPLFAIIKSTLQTRGLTDVFHGGISSYPLLLLIRTSMKLRPTTELAENLLNFFRFYSEFDSTQKAIGPNPFPTLFDKIKDKNEIPALSYPNTGDERYVHASWELSAANPSMPFLLCLQDPTDKHNDVGRKTYAWKHIAESIKRLKEGLEQRLAESEEGSGVESFLNDLVGTHDRLLSERRERIRQYGAKVLADPNYTTAMPLTAPPKSNGLKIRRIGHASEANSTVAKDDSTVLNSTEDAVDENKKFKSPFSLSKQEPTSPLSNVFLEPSDRPSDSLTSDSQQTRRYHSIARPTGSPYTMTSSTHQRLVMVSPVRVRWRNHISN